MNPRKHARIVLLTALLAAPGLALAEGAPPPPAAKTGESAAKPGDKHAAKPHKKEGAKHADKDKAAAKSGDAPQH